MSNRATSLAAPSRNVAVLGASLFGLALGEELWQAYVPVYLTALGASGLWVGLFGSLKDLLDSLYQYPGGWWADRVGRRIALMTFTAVAMAGYLVYALAPHWSVLYFGLFGVMAWKAGAFPTTFAVIGDSLPRGRRGVAFSIQSILIRLPRVIGAPLGGLLIGTLGVILGIKVALAATLVVAGIVLALQYRFFHDPERHDAGGPTPATVRAMVASLPPPLAALLICDCLVRIGESLATSFIVLFVLEVRHVTPATYGLLYAVQQGVAISSYLPGGKFADLSGRRPVIALTFFFFALFPLAVRFASTDAALFAAFVVGGLKEIGEPARKSLIVDLAPDDRRARTVGIYYAIRNLLVVPGGLIGGLLWQRATHLPLEAAFVVSLIGVLVFVAGGREQRSTSRA